MAKVADVNVAMPGSDIGYGLSALLDLLLANGYTIQASGTGTAGARTTTNQLTTPALWIAAANTWVIVFRDSVYVTLLRASATSLTVRFAVVAPATVGSATVPDSQVTAANEVSFASLSITGSSRAHAVTFDSDSNAAGIRSFYLLFTDGSATPRGVVVIEAMADGTYATANPAPYVVTATATGTPFITTSTNWAWWYSPTSVWTSSNNLGVPYASNYLASTATPAGVNPWSTEDQMVPPYWGRVTGAASPGLLGQGATIRAALTFRSYPSTVNLATDAYVYVGTNSGSCLLPWPESVVPL